MMENSDSIERLDNGSIAEILTFITIAELLPLRLASRRINNSSVNCWALRKKQIECQINNLEKKSAKDEELKTYKCHEDSLTKKSIELIGDVENIFMSKDFRN
jgi:hypothetical protein